MGQSQFWNSAASRLASLLKVDYQRSHRTNEPKVVFLNCRHCQKVKEKIENADWRPVCWFYGWSEVVLVFYSDHKGCSRNVKCNYEEQQKQQHQIMFQPVSFHFMDKIRNNYQYKKQQNNQAIRKRKQTFLVRLSVYFAQSGLAVKYFNK